MIIGITGKSSTGKDTAAKFFERHGFEKISLSDEIRNVLRKEGKELTRENQQDKGDEIRKEYGSSALAKRAIRKMEEGKDYVVVSIRNPEEVETLNELDGFSLVNVTAPMEKRLDLARRARVTEGRKDTASTREEFEAMDARETGNENFSQQLDKVSSMADHVLVNNGTLVQLSKKCAELLQSLRR